MIASPLSHFRIAATLGECGMGSVYSAEDTKPGRKVTITLGLASELAIAETKP